MDWIGWIIDDVISLSEAGQLDLDILGGSSIGWTSNDVNCSFFLFFFYVLEVGQPFMLGRCCSTWLTFFQSAILFLTFRIKFLLKKECCLSEAGQVDLADLIFFWFHLWWRQLFFLYLPDWLTSHAWPICSAWLTFFPPIMLFLRFRNEFLLKGEFCLFWRIFHADWE